MIDFYGKCKHIHTALLIFESIERKKVNIICTNAMMTRLIGNTKSESAITLFAKSESFSNDISNILFLKACLNSANYEKCKDWIGSNVNHFYGKCGDINKALHTFNECTFPQRNDMSYVLVIKACLNQNSKNVTKYARENIIKSIDFATLKHRSTALMNELIHFYSIQCRKIRKAVLKCYINGNGVNGPRNPYISTQKHIGLSDDISHILIIKTCLICSDLEKWTQYYQKSYFIRT